MAGPYSKEFVPRFNKQNQQREGSRLEAIVKGKNLIIFIFIYIIFYTAIDTCIS